jgi:serine/threonine-protein kinase
VPATPIATGELTAGVRISEKYVIRETLAQGGTGIVVLAADLALQRTVAIKYLRPGARNNPNTVERFVREARLAAQIVSEHVVRVHDVGTSPEVGPYMVMEYLEGEDLGTMLARQGHLPIPQAVDLVFQACDALAEAHALHIVHRDIKPENLFLARRGGGRTILKVIDFGISKVTPHRRQEGGWGFATGSNECFGTPVYMSPEQLRASTNVDLRADIWALGVVLYELTTGELPFPTAELPTLCTTILNSAPLPTGLPSPLEDAIFRCLEKRPEARFFSCAALAHALAAYGPPDAAARVERMSQFAGIDAPPTVEVHFDEPAPPKVIITNPPDVRRLQPPL